MRKVLIDPYMFFLSDESQIKSNLDFFTKIIGLCTTKEISIILYSDLKQSLLNRGTTPFPIQYNKLSSDIKDKVIKINEMFCRCLYDNLGVLDKDVNDCDGTQEFISIPDISSDSYYFELLNVMLTKCYDKEFDIENIVLYGNDINSVPVNNRVEIQCECPCKKYKELFSWEKIGYVYTPKLIARDYLIDNVSSNCFVSTPDLMRSEHHCPLQNDGKDISSYSSLSMKNKSVIKILRYFGLKKIILTNFSEDSKYCPGTIIIKSCNQNTAHDILKGALYCETGFKTGIELYFPNEIGKCLFDYLGYLFDYNSVEELKTTLGC